MIIGIMDEQSSAEIPRWVTALAEEGRHNQRQRQHAICARIISVAKTVEAQQTASRNSCLIGAAVGGGAAAMAYWFGWGGVWTEMFGWPAVCLFVAGLAYDCARVATGKVTRQIVDPLRELGWNPYRFEKGLVALETPERDG